MTRIWFFAERRIDGQWRIFKQWNGATEDICGAVDEGVAWTTCRILIDMRAVLS